MYTEDVNTSMTPWAIRDESGCVWNGKGETGWHTDFSWVADDGNSISKTSRRLCKTLVSGFLPADHRQLLHTLINHMQMSLQRHWGMIRTLTIATTTQQENKTHRKLFSEQCHAAMQMLKSCGEKQIKMSNHDFFFFFLTNVTIRFFPPEKLVFNLTVFCWIYR